MKGNTNRLKAIETMTMLLYSKGYRGRFTFNGGNTLVSGELRNCLEAFFGSFDRNENPGGEFQLNMALPYDALITCDLKLKYDIEQGFLFTGLMVSHLKTNEKKQYRLTQNQQLPGVQAIYGLFPKPKPWQNLLKGKFRIFLLILCITGISAHAQTYEEWFQQEATQKKYLIQQIAALKIYAGYLKKGYDVVKDGTELIGGITDGEFSLHNEYFNSRRKVNREIFKDGKVDQILRMQQMMEAQRQIFWNKVNASEYFTPVQKSDLRKLVSGLSDDCDRELKELELLITDGKWEMTDDERIKRIGVNYLTTQNLYSLHGKVFPAVLSMGEMREKEKNDLELMKRLFGSP